MSGQRPTLPLVSTPGGALLSAWAVETHRARMGGDVRRRWTEGHLQSATHQAGL